MSSEAPPDFSLVLACYNEGNIIDDRVGKIFAALDALRFGSEVIFVDDASKDDTSRLIDRILSDNPARRLRKIGHASNSGRGGAVHDGIRAAAGRFVGYIDIDLEVAPANILPCLLALESGVDVATVRRIIRPELSSLHRFVMSKVYAFLVRRLTAVPFRDTETGFKTFRRDRILPVIETVQDRGWFWDTELMVRAHLAGLRILEIPAVNERCTDKISSVRIWKDSIDYLQKLLRFSRAIARERRGTR